MFFKLSELERRIRVLNRTSLLLQIFWTFFLLGPVSFGGGYAMISLIERQVVTKRNWIKEEDIADLLAVAETVPGAIAINTSTFIGHRIAGVPGAIAAMLGIFLPTFTIVIVLCLVYLNIQDHPKIEAAFQGIRAAIIALITYAGLKIAKVAILDKSTLLIVIFAVFTLLFIPIHPIFIIMSGALLGIILINLKEKLGCVVQTEKSNQNK